MGAGWEEEEDGVDPPGMKAVLIPGIPAAGGVQGDGGEGLQGKGFVRRPARSVQGPPGSSVSPPRRSRCVREPGQGGARRGGAGPRGRQGLAGRVFSP